MRQLVLTMDHTIITESFGPLALGAELRVHFFESRDLLDATGRQSEYTKRTGRVCFSLDNERGEIWL